MLILREQKKIFKPLYSHLGDGIFILDPSTPKIIMPFLERPFGSTQSRILELVESTKRVSYEITQEADIIEIKPNFWTKKGLRTFFKKGFYSYNIILIIFYLFPGSILGCFLYNDCYLQPQITRDFIISSNHFYAFFLLTSLGVFSFHNTKKINFLIIYLFLLSIILELFHIIIPNRGFEMSDLFGNIVGVILVILIYKIVIRYVKT